MSPHDWDHWDKLEEGPNEKAIYSPEDLSSLLWERLGGNMVRKYQDDSNQVREEVLYNEEGVPAIVLDKSENEVLEEKLPKTSMPTDDGFEARVVCSIQYITLFGSAYFWKLYLVNGLKGRNVDAQLFN